MRSRYHPGDPRQAHFVTSTIVQWLPVFTTRTCCDILTDALRYCQTHKALQLYAWVILDTQITAASLGTDTQALSDAMGDFNTARVNRPNAHKTLSAAARDVLAAAHRFKPRPRSTSWEFPVGQPLAALARRAGVG